MGKAHVNQEALQNYKATTVVSPGVQVELSNKMSSIYSLVNINDVKSPIFERTTFERKIEFLKGFYQLNEIPNLGNIPIGELVLITSGDKSGTLSPLVGMIKPNKIHFFIISEEESKIGPVPTLISAGVSPFQIEYTFSDTAPSCSWRNYIAPVKDIFSIEDKDPKLSKRILASVYKQFIHGYLSIPEKWIPLAKEYNEYLVKEKAAQGKKGFILDEGLRIGRPVTVE